ncbi:glutaredoxin 3 [Marinagarivorans cellulosilyticus]|uniref:Glutaredoxin n=1 Tax=Marinagarivorans cellulosilyticus TaxID=2721545 RepID=A0AAN2BKE7_9GAMM|nr:glutaredoxin 3 [Marinagarivorans cellulosilyticus]BCD97905.1 glutaredoxin 3 [Marinagarivorans cellulosilyticus]
MSITVYSKQFCPYCVMAKRLLVSKGANFTEIKVDSDDAMLKKMMADSGQRTVPQIWIGQTHVGGYDDLAELQQKGQLDALLATEG